MVYAKKVQSTDPRFKDRDVILTPLEEYVPSVIPVPDTVVPCNGCNKNIYPDPGYLIYLGKRELDQDLLYDFYCEDCIKRCFPQAEVVS